MTELRDVLILGSKVAVVGLVVVIVLCALVGWAVERFGR